jgi:hypothetical protein
MRGSWQCTYGVDGKVGSADVEYKIPGEAKFRVTTKPIHKLVLVVLVEEQTTNKGEGPGEEEEALLNGEKDPTEGAEQTPEEGLVVCLRSEDLPLKVSRGQKNDQEEEPRQ